jgi:hypothetical protein
MSRIITPGVGDCPDCGKRVLFALAATGDTIRLDEGQDGPVVVRWDCTGTPRVRPLGPSGVAPEGQHRFRLHTRTCRVVSLGTARARKGWAAPVARPPSAPRRHLAPISDHPRMEAR